jgi:1,4-dihydroxy-2-naphthoyl-CoA hydrolase
MSIWHSDNDLEKINSMGSSSMTGLLEINVTKINDDGIEATMPVNEKTKQPFGLLHGGASCVLAETIGSIASNMVIDQKVSAAVGQSINANHLKSAREGLVRGVCKAIHIGGKSHVWEINIYNNQDSLVCVSRLTMAVIEKRSK